jgi:hypothetical protein
MAKSADVKRRLPWFSVNMNTLKAAPEESMNKVQGLVGHQPFQSAIFLLKFAHAVELTDRKAAVFSFPIMKGLFRNPMFAANLGDLMAKVLLFENSNNLLFFEFGLFHRFLKVKLENQILTCMKKPATYRRKGGGFL